MVAKDPMATNRVDLADAWMAFRVLVAVAAFVGSLSLASGEALARTETVRWQHVHSSDVVGFRIYLRDPGGSYVVASFDGLPTPSPQGDYETTIDVADGATVVAAVTAYDAQGLESTHSNERTFDPPAGGSRGGSGGEGEGGSGGGSGGGGPPVPLGAPGKPIVVLP